MTISAILDTVIFVFEIAGVVALTLGFACSVVFALRTLKRGRGGSAAFQTLRRSLGGTILLGLEIFVAADIMRTVVTPSLDEALVLGIIVIIRTVLSFSIQIEIDGVVPWKRALLRSGGHVLADIATKEG